MRLLWCMVMVALVSGAAVIQDLVDESAEDDDNTDGLWRSHPVDAASDEIEDDREAKSMNLVSVPLTYHIPSSVHVHPLSYHVPGAVYNVPGPVYNVPRPLSAPPKTPASTVLLPMLGQPSATGARSEGEVFSASARGNAWDTCFWLFDACTGINIPEEIGILFPSTYGAMLSVTPGYLRYGYGIPVGPSVQYPVHVAPQAGVPVPTTYGAHFWCGIFTWKCLPDVSGLPVNIQTIIRNGLGLVPFIG